MVQSNVHKEKIDYDEIKKTFSTPESTQAFVEATGIDTFAAAVGNLHGKYPVPKILDLELLQQIRNAVDCNISLHGGSGTPGHYFRDAVKIGVTKININSDMRYAYRTTLEKVLNSQPRRILGLQTDQQRSRGGRPGRGRKQARRLQLRRQSCGTLKA